MLSSKGTAELEKYVAGLRTGTYSFGLSTEGYDAASQLGFGNRFAGTYDLGVEEGKDRIAHNGSVNIDEITSYLNSILSEEKKIDLLTLQKERRFAAIIYLRAMQNGECSFPNIYADVPNALTVLSELRRTHPTLNLDASNRVFVDIYDSSIKDSRDRAAQGGKSISIYHVEAIWRTAILNYVETAAIAPIPSRASTPASTPTQEVKHSPNGKRLALVIGNQNYEFAPQLRNTITDATAIGDALRSVGFQVTLLKDVTRNQLVDGLKQFAHDAPLADWAVVYFAGHENRDEWNKLYYSG